MKKIQPKEKGRVYVSVEDVKYGAAFCLALLALVLLTIGNGKLVAFLFR